MQEVSRELMDRLLLPATLHFRQHRVYQCLAYRYGAPLHQLPLHAPASQQRRPCQSVHSLVFSAAKAPWGPQAIRRRRLCGHAGAHPWKTFCSPTLSYQNERHASPLGAMTPAGRNKMDSIRYPVGPSSGERDPNSGSEGGRVTAGGGALGSEVQWLSTFLGAANEMGDLSPFHCAAVLHLCHHGHRWGRSR